MVAGNVLTTDRALGDRKVTVQGSTLQVLTAGEGPALLYLHAGDGLDNCRNLIRHLAPDVRIFAPSPPGFDDSDPVGNFRTVDDLSYLYLDLMEALDIRNAVLVGVSFGAWLAAEIAVKTQERIGSIVLINPVGIKIGAPEDQDISDIFYCAHRDVRRLLYADGRSDENDYSQSAPEVVARTVRNREALTWFGWSPLLHNPSLHSRLHRIRVPTLVLRAERDRVTTERYTQAYCDAIPGARLEIVPDAGHSVHDERPTDVAARIAAFVGLQRARSERRPPLRAEERGL